MRIALITTGFNAGPDDHSYHYLASIASRLSAEHEVDVLTLRYPEPARRYSLVGAQVTALGWMQSGGLTRLPLLARALASTLRGGLRRRYDVIHAFWSDEPGFTALVAGRLTGSPVVVSLMGGELAALRDLGYGGGLSRVIPRLSSFAVTRADAVTVGSTFLQRMASDHYPAVQPLLLPLGVDSDRFHPRPSSRAPNGFEPAHFNLLQVAGLAPVKDQRTSLRAFAAVVAEQPQAHFHLVGHGPSQPELERLVLELGIGAAVTFHGHVPWPEVPAYYGAADLYLHSSRHEAQGMAILEAAACGLPIVATTVGIVPDLPQAAVAVPVGDWRAMARATLELVSDSDRRQRMAQAGPATVRASFSIEHYMDRLMHLYGTLAG